MTRLRWLLTLIAILGMAGLTGPAMAGAALLAPTEITPPAIPPDPHADLNETSCWAAGDCVAVGTYEDSTNEYHGVLETISGTSVSATQAPTPANVSATASGTIVNDVACPAAGACVAVGEYHDSSGFGQGLLLSQTPSGWAATELQLPGTPAGNPQVNLASVSCPAAGKCVAVGSWYKTSSDAEVFTVTSTPSAGGAVWGAAKALTMPSDLVVSGSASLQQVSCSSVGNCGAVGNYQATGGYDGLAVSEVSGTWHTAVGIVAPAGGQSLDLNGVSCPADGSCTAIGNYNDNGGGAEVAEASATAATWGAAATKVTLPADAGAQTSLYTTKISCSTTVCAAAGSYTDTQSHTQALGVIGSTGYEIQTPSSAGTNPNASLSGVQCTGATCTALGYFTDKSGLGQLMAVQYSAGWHAPVVIAAPATASSDPSFTGQYLASPSCAAGQCVAAGFLSDQNGDYQPELAAGSATSWVASQPPLPAGAGALAKLINAPNVACAGNGNCAAVGTLSSSRQHPGLLNEAGGTVTAPAVPLPVDAQPGTSGTLAGVACPAIGGCIAIGYYTHGVSGSGGQSAGLILPESGGNWLNPLAPTPPQTANLTYGVTLSSVACASSGNCLVGGSYTDQNVGNNGMLVVESNGSWARGMVAPELTTTGTPRDGVTATACIAGGACSALGWALDASANVQAAVYTQANGAWTVTEIPAPAGAATSPNTSSTGQLRCPASGACTGAWTYTDAASATQIMLANQSGGNWGSATELTFPGAAANPHAVLSGLSCTAAGDCVVVGYFTNTGGTRSPFIAEESGGKWGTTLDVTPAGTVSGAILRGVSCVSQGNCVAVGDSVPASGEIPLLEVESGGNWSSAAVPSLVGGGSTGSAAVLALLGVACVPTGGCWITGQDTAGYAVALNITAPTTLALSGAPGTGVAGAALSGTGLSATFGADVPPGGNVSFTVFGPSAAPPSTCTSGGTSVGSSSVSGSSAVGGAGSFTPSAAGDYWWYASYSGDALDDPSATACGSGMPETVVSAATVVTPPKPVAKPVAKLVKVKVKGSLVSVTVSCTVAACPIKLTLTVPGKKTKKVRRPKPVTVASFSGTLRAGQTKTISLKPHLSAKKVKAALTLTLVKTKVGSKGVTLPAAPKRKRKR